MRRPGHEGVLVAMFATNLKQMILPKLQIGNPQCLQ
jgi:hypothetical protein